MGSSGNVDAGQVSGHRAPAERARVLLEINNAVVSHLDLARVLKSVSDCLRREIKHDFAALALYNEELHELRSHALDFPDGQPIDAGIMRLRPVMITVGATVLALFPLALHGGPLWQPLCYTQIGGLAVATFITLLLVPVLYAILCWI